MDTLVLGLTWLAKRLALQLLGSLVVAYPAILICRKFNYVFD